MSNNVKTYQFNFSIVARDIDEAIEKAKIFLESKPDDAIEEI